MRSVTSPSVLTGLVSVLLLHSGCSGPEASAGQNGPEVAPSSPSGPVYVSWPSSPGEAYASIDGHHLWQYVKEQADIAERYRDQGHPQFWGRIAGTSGDVEDAQWLLEKFQGIGLSDTHIQDVAMFLPQWVPESWEVSVTAGGKTTSLTSAQPPYGSTSTDGRVLDMPVAYVGLGSEADFAGRNVRGKAVLFLKTQPTYSMGATDILKRAEDRGAAAVFSADLRGGNYKLQSYRSYTEPNRTYTSVPNFELGTEDALTLRDMIASTPAGQPPHVQLRLDATWESGQKSFLVWGTLPGATDETVYVVAHRDGWFDAAGDNASGVASMLGLAEYYAKIPQTQRPRTMIFIGTDGHHQIRPGWYGAIWLARNREKLFSKTALMLNAEHPAEVLTHGGVNGVTETIIPLEWYAGGPQRPELAKIASDAFHEFGVPIWAEPSATPPGGDLAPFSWFLPGVVAQSNDFMFMHSDGDTPETISWAGLENATRAYARIIDEVNKLPLSALQRGEEQDPNAPGAPRIALDVTNCAEWLADSSADCSPD